MVHNLPKKHRGFTLIELLVVMTIMGILMAIGFGVYGSVQSKARDARRKQDLASISKALEAYLNDNGSYPAALTFGSSLAHPTKSTVIYMAQVPTDPGATTYLYLPFGVGKSYRLHARLENTQDSAVPKDAAGKPGIYRQVGSNSCGGSGCNYRVTSSEIVFDAAAEVGPD